MRKQLNSQAATRNGRFESSHKPTIKPLTNMVNIERLLLTGLQSTPRSLSALNNKLQQPLLTL